MKMLLRSLFQRRHLEAELDEEMRDHLDQEIANNMRAGMSRDEATFAARRLTGSISLYQEECRDARGFALIDTFLRDVRQATRTLRRTPMFTVAACITLALSIGANTTIFTFVENIVLHSLPIREPDRVVALNWGGMVNMSYPNYADFRDRNTVFSDLIACRFNQVNLSLRARENFLAWGYEATGNYFETLGIQPFLGRFFGRKEDDAPGAHPVVVVSHRYWREHFGSARDVIGRTVKLNGYAFTIIGVAPPSFSGTELIMAADFWVPMSEELQIEPGNSWYQERTAQNIWVLGRLRPGISWPQAEANLDQIAGQLARTFPKILSGKDRFHLSRPGLIGNAFRKPVTSFGVVLMSIAGAGLLLACVNLAGMLLARASDRTREIGIRAALGASKFQLLRQFMTESLMLAGLGGVAGLTIAFEACHLFSSWNPDFNIPFTTELHPNITVLSFAVAMTFATAMLFGLAPALQAIRTDVAPSLKNEPASAHLRRFSARDVLVALQIAISVMLVISSVLVVRSLQHALTLNFGFRPEGAVAVAFDLRLKGSSPEANKKFDERLLQKASALPGVEGAGIINTMPLRLDHEDNTVISRGDRPMPPPAEQRAAIVYNISPGYLQTAGTTLLSGRDFTSHDRSGAPAVAIVNQALADVLFPKENPLGRRVRLSMDSADKGDEIVGVVETGKYESIGEDPHPAIFLPIEQTGTDWTTLVVRSALPSQTVTDLLRKTVLDLNPELTLSNMGSLKDQLALPLFPARAAAGVLGAFGILAIILAATGLFALMAYAVSKRTKEIGIRMALGARTGQVLSLILGRTMLLCVIGISTGIALTLFGTRLLSGVLYDFSARDPVTYAIALLLVLLVASAAAWNPAARAIRINPAIAIREE